MKILKIATISLLVASSLLANQVPQISQDMRTMLNAMESIQRAGFYNDTEGMKSGVVKLKSGLQSLITTDAKSYLPDDQAYANKFAQKRAKMIEMYANDLVESLKNNKLDDALVDYTQILKECTSCHTRIRNW
ncbi:MAG: hypothetical protein PHI89_05115 [Thiovulaceae bacterium]|nr:hypothetical protein [Sulfurimonadaceae bacterium]MDD3817448.1 hypothetical protein [Sulfurimonadaceae bacterium]